MIPCLVVEGCSMHINIIRANQHSDPSMNLHSCPVSNANIGHFCLSAEHRAVQNIAPHLFGGKRANPISALLLKKVRFKIVFYRAFRSQVFAIKKMSYWFIFYGCFFFFQFFQQFFFFFFKSARVLFTLHCLDSLLALQFTPTGKQEDTLHWRCFQLAWMRTTDQTWQNSKTTTTKHATTKCICAFQSPFC